MERNSLFQEATRVLDWDRVLAVLASQARSTMGAERCRTLFLETDLDAARARMQETAEMVVARESTHPLPSLAFPDVRGPLGRVVKGASLETLELRDVALVLGVLTEVAQYFGRYGEEMPALRLLTASLAQMRHAPYIRSAIDRSIDEEGHIRESATPELRRLIHHAQGLKQQMRHRLEAILESRRYAAVLQERYFAQREGRYVVPIKAEMRSKIPGIVHDVSASGATVFLEPRELVELNNAIKVAELEVEREVRRILQELSRLVADHAPALLGSLEVLARLDCVAAKAGLSHLVKGHTVSLNNTGRIVLRHARHPLLMLSREHVVANDMLLDESVRVLIISGANTGGKTVTLKLVGLVALMVRAGLLPPCGADSEMPLFPEVYADIGDAQDLTRDLSSFSAHITQMIQLLQQTSPSAPSPGSAAGPPKALVLIDEPVTSTDPTEGAVLAEALLVRLANVGLKVVATTHYNSLKALAQTTPGFANASVEFNVTTLSPTYRLIMNVPAGSSAIEIAGRLGMDEAILEHAVGLLGQEDGRLERLLSDVQERQRRLDQEAAQLAELKAEAEQSAREAAEIAERLRASEREERRGAKKKLTEELLRARAQVQEILDGLKRERTLIKAREAKQRLAEVEAQARRDLVRPAEARPITELRTGDQVEIVSLGTVGTLQETPQGKKRVRVRVGEKDMSVAVSGLLGVADSGSGRGSPELRRPTGARTWPKTSVESGAATVLDLRGKTAEEAMELTLAALDRATLEGIASLRIIHGHGTGRLKAVLRDYLKNSPYVATFGAGQREEGGDGVTIAELK